jgi:hypothetical protein
MDRAVAPSHGDPSICSDRGGRVEDVVEACILQKDSIIPILANQYFSSKPITSAVQPTKHRDSLRLTASFDLDDLNVCRLWSVRVGERLLLKVGTKVTCKQMPLIVTYACSVHKVQGLSLRAMKVDLGNTIFCPGQSYVALSRATDPELTCVRNFDPSKVTASKSAVDYYKGLERCAR